MSKVAVLRSEQAMPEKAWGYLGEAEVVDVRPHDVEVRMRGGATARARIATVSVYSPRAGDLVLVIGDAGGHFVIGVLHATGPVELTFDGDVELRAGGVLKVVGEKGLELAGDEIAVQAKKLQVLAGAVIQRFSSLRQRVTELLSVHARESHTVVDGASFSQAKSSTIQSEEKVTINGKQVLLG